MKIVTLSKYCELYGQKMAAKVIGCTQGNVSQMLKNRIVFVVVEDDENSCAFEIRVVGKPPPLIIDEVKELLIASSSNEAT